jgi:hypothetical protein
MDYTKLSVNDRLKEAVRAMLASGVSKPKAQSLAALSMPETTAIWTLPRTTDMWYDVDCFPLRVEVGLEFGEPIFQRTSGDVVVIGKNGRPTIEMYLIRSSAVDDADARNYLLTNKLITPLPTSKGKYVTRQNPPFYMLTGAFAGAGTPEMAKFFEMVLNTEKGRLLDQFSIGPTMQWMAYSGVGSAAIRARPLDWIKQTKEHVPIRDMAWPDTWDDIFHLYVSASAGDLGKKITYMDAPRVNLGGWYPAMNPDDEEKVAAWLAFQVGNLAGAKTYTPNYLKWLNLTLTLT